MRIGEKFPLFKKEQSNETPDTNVKENITEKSEEELGAEEKEPNVEQEKGCKEIVKEKGTEYFQHMIDSKGTQWRQDYEDYKNLVAKEDYFEGVVGKRTTHEFLKYALLRYESSQKKFVADPDISKDYSYQLELVKTILSEMEKDPGFKELIEQGEAVE